MTSVLEIKLIFRKAKQLEENGFLREARENFLDAATIAVNEAKQVEEEDDKNSLLNIANTLVEHAKEIQIKLDFQKKVLSDSFKSVKQLTEEEAEIEILPIHQLLIIRDIGTPVYTFNFDAMSNNETSVQIDEMLFAGALTAIKQLMGEVIRQSIKKITLQEGMLVIHFTEDLAFVIYISNHNPKVEKLLEEFANKFYDQFEEDIKYVIRTGAILDNNKQIEELVHEVFGF
jgi:hypothetical protein